MGRLEVIVRDVYGDRLYIAEDRIGMPGSKLEKLAALICAELQVGVLNEVVHNLLGNLAPLARSPYDGNADGAMKARDKLIPCRAVVALGASSY